MEIVKDSDDLEEKLTELVVRYQLPLLRLCFAYLHDEELAKDAVQDTFLKAYRNLFHFRDASSEQTWLYRIAINTCKDMLRSAWFRHIDRSITIDELPEPIDDTDEQESELTVKIMNLSPKLREAALLCWFQGMTYEAAAETLGISVQAVSGRINRARKKLRTYLERSDQYDIAR